MSSLTSAFIAAAHVARPCVSLRSSFISPQRHERLRKRRRFPALQPALLPPPVLNASLARDQSAFQDVNEAVVKAVERFRGSRVTPSDVAIASGLGVPDAETELARLAGLTGAAVDVTDAGDLAYRFSDVRNKLRSTSLRASVRMAWERAFPYLFTGVRIAFGALLIISIVVTFLAITALMAASRSSDDRDNRGGGGGGLFAMRLFTPNIFDIIFYSRMQQQYAYDREGSSYGRAEPQEMSFLESVYSFVFGDGDPNAGAEARQWKAISAVISANGGSVTAEQLRPFVIEARTPGTNSGAGLVDESDILPVLTRFGGKPEVTEDGEIIYVFPEFSSTARRVEYVGKAAATHLSERTEEFTKATGGQKALAIGLGIVNFGAALTLGVMLGSVTPIGPEAANLLNLIRAIYPAIAAYALTFVLVPMARFFILRRRNNDVMQRNEVRLRAAAELARPNSQLRSKLEKARDYRVEKRVVASKDVVFSSDMDADEVTRRKEQELAEEFDRRMESR